MNPPDAAHIVAIDDAPELLHLYRNILEAERYRVTTLDHCDLESDALLLLAPDLLIVDLRCGVGLGGLELLRRLREHPDGGKVPAIACTALSAAALRNIADDLHALGAHLLVKPFDLDELLVCVQQALALTHAPRFGASGRRVRTAVH